MLEKVVVLFFITYNYGGESQSDCNLNIYSFDSLPHLLFFNLLLTVLLYYVAKK